MKIRGLSQQVYPKFDVLLLPALFFHPDLVTMAARPVPSRQVIGQDFSVDVDIKYFPREYVSHVAILPCHHIQQTPPTPIELPVSF